LFIFFFSNHTTCGDMMKKQSIWLDGVENLNFPSLNENIDVDILIIGGGITGVSLLYELKEQAQNVVLLERNQIGHGVTSKSTAKLNYLQGIVYSQIARHVSYDSARLYLESQIEGIQHIRNIIQKEKIACHFTKVKSILYGTEKDEKDIEREYQFLRVNHIPVIKENNTLSVSDTYVFHPVLYVQALAKCSIRSNIKIYENSKVTDLSSDSYGYLCHVNGCVVRAKKVVLACHYPFQLFPFFLPIRTSIEKSYVMAYPVPMQKKETFITTYPNIVSKRFFKNYEILLSGSHPICNELRTPLHFQKLMQNHRPQFLWSNEDIMTSDSLPFIGQISECLYLATGYNTWGMATSNIAAHLLKDLLNHQQNKYSEVFFPNRSFHLFRLKKYSLNLFYNMKGMFENKIMKKKSWYPTNLSFSMKNGKSIARYTLDGEEYLVNTTCPHLGCTLLFNEVEQTWDCPCHASRFDLKGKCIKGPSIQDITYTESSLK